MQMVSNDKYKKCKYSTSGLKFQKLSYTITKNSVCNQITKHRKEGRKVSMNFAQITPHKRIKML